MSWLQALDVSLFRFINGTLSNPLFDALMPWLSGNRLFIPGALLVSVFLIWRGRTKGILFLIVLAAAIGVTDGLLCNIVKNAVGRPRPCQVLEGARVLLGCSDSASLPSSHAANWFTTLAVAILFSRTSWRIVLPFALAVSFSRVYTGVHYPGDVLVGAVLGGGSGLAVTLGLNELWRWIGNRWFPLWYELLPSLIPAHSHGVPAHTASAPGARSAALDQHWLRAGYLVIAVLTLARWLYIAGRTIELSEDEAYQWVWSKHLALSYYSKPPLIALTQWLGTALWGDRAFGVRFFSPLIAATLGVMFLRFFAREVNPRTGFFFVLIVTAVPLLTVGATLLTVDPLAVLFWTAAMFSGWRAVQPNSPLSTWLWTGLWMGLGFLSKYTSPLQWMCWAAFFVLWPPAREHLRRPGPYLALLINLVCTLPVIVWNWQHHWITVRHVASHGGVGKAAQPLSKHLSWFFEFLGAEFVLLNPVFFIATLIALIALWRVPRREARMVYFFCMGAPVFLLYALLSLNSRVHPNWIAPSVLPMLCVMVLYWQGRFQPRPGFLKVCLTSGLIFGCFAALLIHDTNVVRKFVGQPLPPQVDPLRRVRGQAEMARIVSEAKSRLAREGKPTFVIGEHYGITSLLTFYEPEARQRVQNAPLVFCQPSEKPSNQYYFWPGYLETHSGQNALFVRERDLARLAPDWIPRWLTGHTNLIRLETLPVPNPAPEWLTGQFDSVTNLGIHEVLVRGRLIRKIEIFECRNLR
ncbi:MAG TPA: glycosyltransferase family 39 protein [Verrucomicrobiae bacterium]|nr:glycosyltransferase family 39 protein [Verrucomicrobiae bacterium]